MVINIDDTVAVTQNFVNIHNLEHVCESLISEKDKHNMWETFHEKMLKTYPYLEPFIARKVSIFSDTTDDPVIKEEGFTSRMDFLEGFRDINYWHPRVIDILERCSLDKNVPIEVISHGQNPVFRSPTAIIKFYSHIFNGVKTFNAEIQTYSIITDHIPERYKGYFSKILGSGYLFNESIERNYRWPYIVFESATDGGISLAEVIAGGGSSPSNEVIDFSVEILHALHSLPSACIPENTKGTTPEHPFHQFIQLQISRASKVHSGWLIFPLHLISQISSYLPSSSYELHNSELDGPLAGILHGDLNAENILGVVLPSADSSNNLDHNHQEHRNNCSEDDDDDELLGYWTPTTIIDFGDSQVYGGDPLFDLIPIYISVLRCSKLLLKGFIEKYNNEIGGKQKISLRMFKRRAMWYTLLWEFEGAVRYLIGHFPNVRECKNWEEVEDLVWGIE